MSLIVAAEAGIVTLTLDRPERRNALSEGVLSQLESALITQLIAWAAAGH